MKVLLLILPFVLTSVVSGKRDGLKRDRTRHSGSRTLNDEETPVSDIGQCELEITCKGATSSSKTPVRLPIKGPRGQQGRAGEKGKDGEPGKQGPQGIPGKSAEIVQHVAFFVGLGNNIGAIKEDKDVVFDKLVTNVGGAYDPETGKFTAPYSGTFQFSVVVAAQGQQQAAVDLVRNGTMVVRVWAHSIPYWATSSNTAILNLTTGDQVWLRVLKRAPYLHGYMYTSFSGFSLFTEQKEYVTADKSNNTNNTTVGNLATNTTYDQG